MTQTEINQIVSEVIESIGIAQKEILTSDEVCKYLGISKSYLYKLTFNKAIPHYKPKGKMCYFNRPELDKWVQANRIATDEEIASKAMDYCRKGGAL